MPSEACVGLEELARSLWPRPRELRALPGVVTAANVADAPREVVDRRFAREAYRLELAAEGPLSVAATPVGFAHARATWAQLRAAASARPLPALVVEDAPLCARRGVLIDVSRDKVPRLAELARLIDLFASFKINEVQLHFEHVFAYRGAEAVWGAASPYRPEDVRALAEHCRRRHVALVPHQQSFGHLHRWLKHEPWRRLAEVPEGIEHAFSPEREPYGLCAVDPASLDFLAGLYDELLPHFDGDLFHVGLDEAIDLGRGRSRERCERLGRTRVYLEFLHGVHALVRARGRRMMFWADELAAADHAGELPPDVMPCIWGYEADTPFADHARPFRAAGLEVVLCPGTASWQSIGGRTDTMLANIAAAAQAAATQDAAGVLVCDWGDRGHFQPPAVAEPGWILGTGLAWNPAPATGDLRALHRDVLDRLVHADPRRALGTSLASLGDLERLAAPRQPATNGTSLFFALAFAHEPSPPARAAGLDLDGVRAAGDELARLRRVFGDAQGERADAALARAELLQACDLLTFAARLTEARLNAPAGRPLAALEPRIRAALRAELLPLIATHREQWLVRNRPGGLADSAGRLTRIAGLLA